MTNDSPYLGLPANGGGAPTTKKAVGPHCPPDERRPLVERAQRLYRHRQARGRLFNPDYFGEPAWDILLALYIEAGARSMNVTSAALVANTPETTTLRWVEALEAEGLIESHTHASDKRLRLIRLSLHGCAIMDRYLRGILHE